jgi:hypothetical protein
MNKIMNFLKICIFAGYIFSFGFFISFPVHAQENQSIDEHVNTPLIIRNSYTTASIEANSAGGKKGAKGTKQGSILPFSNLTTGALSAIGTVLSVIIGAVFTWVKIKKRNSLFNNYLKQVETQRDQIIAQIKSSPHSKEKLVKSLQEDFKKLRENAELSTAEKKIEESQLTVITHKIEDVVHEILPHSSKKDDILT